MPQYSYTHPEATARPGQPGSSRAAMTARVDSFDHPRLVDQDTVTVGGTASAGVYAFEVFGVEVSFTRTSETNDQIADELVTAGEQVAALQSRAEFTKGSTGEVVVTAKTPGEDLGTLVTQEPGTGTLTVTADVDVGSEVQIPAGVGVKRGTNAGELAPLEGGDTAADVIGVTRLSEAGIDEYGDASEDGYSAGSMIPVQRDADIYVLVEDSPAIGGSVFVRVTAGAGEQAGAFRTDTDSGDAVQLTNCEWASTASGSGAKRTAKITIKSVLP